MQKTMIHTGWNLENSYSGLPEMFFFTPSTDRGPRAKGGCYQRRLSSVFGPEPGLFKNCRRPGNPGGLCCPPRHRYPPWRRPTRATNLAILQCWAMVGPF